MPGSSQPQTDAPAPRGAIEAADVSVKGVIWFLVILVAIILVCYISLTFLFRHYRRLAELHDQQIRSHSVVSSIASHRPYFPQPREQFSPQLDLKALRAEQGRELNSYGWIDQKAGVVRIPIDRAMDLVLQRGLPARSGSNAPNAGPSSLQLQQQRPVQSSPPSKEEGK